MIFEADNFIKEYLDTDKFITIQYPNGKRYMSINVSQNKKVTLNSKQISIYQEGRLPSNINFHSELEAQTAFSILNDTIDTLRNNTNNNINTFESVIKMKKHSSVTAEHIGLLAMQEVTVLTENPQSVDDFQVQVKVADTVPATAGEKGQYTAEIAGEFIFTPPETKIVRVTFTNNQNPLSGMQLAFSDNEGFGTVNLTFKKPFPNSNQNEIMIGNTLSDTLDNLEVVFTNGLTPLTSEFARVVGRGVDVFGYAYIDFELHWNAATDAIKYMAESAINIVPFTFPTAINRVGLDINDAYDEYLTIVLAGTPDVNDLDAVVSIGGVSVVTDLKMNVNTQNFYHSGHLVTSWMRYPSGHINLVTVVGQAGLNGVYFTPYLTNQGLFSINVERALDVITATKAHAIYNAATNGFSLWFAESWDSNGGTQLLPIAKIFRNDSGQPNGTFGAFGLKYFSSHAEVISALEWALSETEFPNMFDVTVAMSHNNIDMRYEMSFENKTVPTGSSYIYFNNQNIQDLTVNTSIQSEAVQGLPERIENTIVGKIVGVEGDNALISTAFIEELTMCSSEDGALGVLPLTASSENNFVSLILAWRQGKVIDLAGYSTIMQNAGFGGDSIILGHMLIGGIFRPLTVAGANDKIIVDKRSYQFFD